MDQSLTGTALVPGGAVRAVTAERNAATPKPTRQVIKRRGALGSLLFPIGVACGLVIVGIPAISIWNIYSASEARRAAHETPVKTSGTRIETPVRRQIRDDQTEFVLRLQDGKLVRVLAGKTEANAFLTGALAYIDSERQHVRQQVHTDLDRLFVDVFATREADLNAYADWFFAWGRSWSFLYEAGTGAVQEMARLFFSKTQVADAARNSAEDYLLRNYSELVLKPGIRDGQVAEGLRSVLRTAHQRYLMTVAGLDDRVQRFLAEETDHLEEISANEVGIVIDWDAEKWKAPLYRVEDRYLEPIGTVATVGGGAILGGMVARAMVPIFARAAARIVTTSQMTVGGAAVGSIEPGLGTAIGALAGAGLDWAMSVFRERLERDDFIRENAAALDATIATWKARLEPELLRPVNAWYDDSMAAVRLMADAAGR
jgi:hypothetical protein